VLGRREQLPPGSRFDDDSRARNGDVVGYRAHDAEVVGDEKQGEPDIVPPACGVASLAGLSRVGQAEFDASVGLKS
jgi:hypothetical protein